MSRASAAHASSVAKRHGHGATEESVHERALRPAAGVAKEHELDEEQAADAQHEQRGGVELAPRGGAPIVHDGPKKSF